MRSFSDSSQIGQVRVESRIGSIVIPLPDLVDQGRSADGNPIPGFQSAGHRHVGAVQRLDA